jgi:hypothetical protein
VGERCIINQRAGGQQRFSWYEFDVERSSRSVSRQKSHLENLGFVL